MPMQVMHVRYMGVAVRERFMTMHVAMRSGLQRIVRVQVMAVFMGMRMLVFLRLMHMRMRVTLHQVQQHACQHQERPTIPVNKVSNSAPRQHDLTHGNATKPAQFDVDQPRGKVPVINW